MEPEDGQNREQDRLGGPIPFNEDLICKWVKYACMEFNFDGANRVVLHLPKLWEGSGNKMSIPTVFDTRDTLEIRCFFEDKTFIDMKMQSIKV